MEKQAIRFGVVADEVRTPGELIALATWMEASGFSSLLLRDHVVEYTFGHQLGPLVAMTLAATHTTTLRIGTMVIANDYRPPVLLAKEIATLDAVSGGRVELGLGAGFLKAEYEPLGIPFEPPGVRVSRLEESVRLLKLLFKGGPVTFRGEHYNLSKFENFPLSSQASGPPILIAGSGDRMLRLAAREADIVGIQTASTTTGSGDVDNPSNRFADEVERKVNLIRSAAGERFSLLELSTTVMVEVTDDRGAGARRIIARRGWHGVDVATVLQIPSLLVGTLAEIGIQIRQNRDRFGLSYLVVSHAQAALIAPIVPELSGS